jgi:hypothetical protein
VRLLWTRNDKWAPYLLTHMKAIRAKYFPGKKPSNKLDGAKRDQVCVALVHALLWNFHCYIFIIVGRISDGHRTV